MSECCSFRLNNDPFQAAHFPGGYRIEGAVPAGIQVVKRAGEDHGHGRPEPGSSLVHLSVWLFAPPRWLVESTQEAL